MAESLFLVRNITRLVEAPNTINVFYSPANEGIEDVVGHGVDLKIPKNGTVAATADAYEPTALTAIYAVLNAKFPGAYSIE